MPKIFSVDILICATAYVIAETAEEAANAANGLCADGFDASTVEGGSFGDVPVSGDQYEDMLADDETPEVTVSPALTFKGCASALHERRSVFTAADMEVAHDPEEA